jgi:hypothetical protein
LVGVQAILYRERAADFLFSRNIPPLPSAVSVVVDGRPGDTGCSFLKVSPWVRLEEIQGF